MKVSVKLMASLRGCLPPDCKGGAVTLDLDDGASVETVLQRLGIAQGLVHLVMVNDILETDRAHALAEGDDLLIIPPVAGGQSPRLDRFGCGKVE